MENYLITWEMMEDDEFDVEWFYEWLGEHTSGTDFQEQADGYLLMAGCYPDDEDPKDVPDFIGHAGGGSMNASHDIISG